MDKSIEPSGYLCKQNVSEEYNHNKIPQVENITKNLTPFLYCIHSLHVYTLKRRMRKMRYNNDNTARNSKVDLN